MHRTKLPLTYWFLVIFLVSTGQRCSALWLSSTLQLNYRTALRLLRSVREGMRKHNGKHPLSNILEADDPVEIIEVVLKAKQSMLQQIKQFTRLNYRCVQPHYLQGYAEEFYFRKTNPSERSGSSRMSGRPFTTTCLFSTLLRHCTSIQPLLYLLR
jgi:hypothetical protein